MSEKRAMIHVVRLNILQPLELPNPQLSLADEEGAFIDRYLELARVVLQGSTESGGNGPSSAE